jgi:hypothetical protein
MHRFAFSSVAEQIENDDEPTEPHSNVAWDIHHNRFNLIIRIRGLCSVVECLILQDMGLTKYLRRIDRGVEYEDAGKERVLVETWSTISTSACPRAIGTK